MHKWEYCAVGPIKNVFYGHYPELVRFTKEGSKKTRIQGTRDIDEGDILAQTIAQLGEWGWEMISCGTVAKGVQEEPMHILYFKRPIEP